MSKLSTKCLLLYSILSYGFIFCDTQTSHGSQSPNIKTTGSNSRVTVNYNGLPLIVTKHVHNTTPLYGKPLESDEFETLGNGTQIKILGEYKKVLRGELAKVKIIECPLPKYNGKVGWINTRFISQVFN